MAANERSIPLEIVTSIVIVARDRAAELINLPNNKGVTALSNAQAQQKHRRKSDVIDYLQGVLKEHSQ